MAPPTSMFSFEEDIESDKLGVQQSQKVVMGGSRHTYSRASLISISCMVTGIITSLDRDFHLKCEISEGKLNYLNLVSYLIILRIGHMNTRRMMTRS